MCSTLTFSKYLEMCLLNKDIMYYVYIAQGKTTIPGVDDAEELRLTDVSGGQARARLVDLLL